MARKRMIDPGIWESEDFSELDNFAKLIWIGLFSQADDEGRGKCKPVFLRSLLFPYSEDSKLIKNIDNALNQISRKMSITFYQLEGNDYYQLENWTKWQKVDKPQLSKIPPLKDETKVIRRAFGERSPKDMRTIDECSPTSCDFSSPKIIEQNKKSEENNNARVSEDEFKKSLSQKYPRIDINADITKGNYDTNKLLEAIGQSKYLQEAPLSFILRNYDRVITNCYKTIKQIEEPDFEQRQYSKEELNDLFDSLSEVEDERVD